MATIDQVRQVADTRTRSEWFEGDIVKTDTAGVGTYQWGGETVLVSAGTNIVMDNNELAAQLVNSLTRSVDGPDGDVTGNDLGNYIIGNNGTNIIDAADGDDQVATGGGDDEVDGGAGDDTIIADGTGTKIITGGEGNDTFLVEAFGSESKTTITDLETGDKLRWDADANGDGVVNLDDVDKTFEADGNTTLVLVDGTKMVLEGVTGLFAGGYDFKFGVEDDDAFVDITHVDDV
jgi:hypothetical protein